MGISTQSGVGGQSPRVAYDVPHEDGSRSNSGNSCDLDQKEPLMASRSRHYKTPMPDARVAFCLTGIGC